MNEVRARRAGKILAAAPKFRGYTESVPRVCPIYFLRDLSWSGLCTVIQLLGLGNWSRLVEIAPSKVGDGRLPRKRAPHRSPPWARGRRARVCDHPELGVDAPSAPACIRERSRALPVCDHLRQARQTTLGESGVAKLAECNLEGIKAQ